MFDRRRTRHVGTLLLLLAAACGGTDSSTEGKVEQSVPTPKILSFESLPEHVTAGTPATLHWTTRDAASIALADGNGNPLPVDGADLASGSIEVLPAQTTSYTLSATGAPGAAGPVWRTVTVVVEPVSPDAPTIEAFAAAPEVVAVGQEVVLSWRTSNAARLTLKDDAAVEIDLGDANLGEGQVAVRPARPNTAYSLTATGPGGRASATVAVTVEGLPRVSRFFLDPIAPVNPGDEVTVSWETIDAQHVVVLQGDEELVSSDTELAGSRRIALEDNAEFRIVATGHGQTATARVLAQVGARIVSFTASNRVVRLGDPIDLAWQLEGADRATIVGPAGYQLQLVGADLVSGTATVNLAARGDFLLTAFRGEVARTAALALEITEAPRVRSITVDQPIVTADAGHPATVNLSWVQDGADTCTIFRNNVEVPAYTSFACGPTGTAAVQVFGNTTLRLVASNAHGNHSATAEVQAVPTATIAALASNPSRRLTPGSTVELSWQVTDAVSVSMEKNGAPFAIGATAFTGTATDRVDFDSTYVLTALNSLGFPTVQSLEVRAGAPVILSAVAQPAFAGIGAAVTLRWTADGGETLTIVDHDAVELFRTTDPAMIDHGSFQVLVPVVAGTYHYTIRSTNGAGTFDEETVEVIVSDGPMIDSFSTNRTSLTLGETLTLSWAVRNDPTGNVPTLTLVDNYANAFDLTGKNPNLGSITITPAEEGPHFYTLTASTGPTRTAATATAGSAVAPIEVTVPPRALAFSATPDRVSTANGTVVPDVVLAWQSENGVEVTLWESDAAGNVIPPAIHRVSLANGATQSALDAGSHHVGPTATTWYVLRVKNRVGSYVDRRLKVIVDPPEVLTLTATPGELVEGQPTLLEWTTRNATSVNFDPPAGPLAVSPAAFPFVDVSTTGTMAALYGDGQLETIPFPAGFTFPFDGVGRTSIQVSTNGWAGFGTDNTAVEHYPAAFPIDTKRYVNFAPYWCDLDSDNATPNGHVWYGMGSDAMGDYFVVQWKDWQWYSSTYGPGNLNFEIILRRSGLFEYRYGSMTANTAERGAGEGCGIGYQYPGTGSIAANIVTYNVAVAGGLANKGFALGAILPVNGSLSVSPTKTTTYTLAALNPDASASQQVTVTVWKNPVISSVRVLPAAPESTKPFKIEWSVANATHVRVVDANNATICDETDPGRVLSGSCTYAEPTGGYKAYTLQAMNGPLAAPMATATRPFSVNVFPLLSLDSFAITPGEFVTNGTQVSVTWTGRGATEVELLACTPNTNRSVCTDITPSNANPNGGTYTQTMTKSVEFWLRIYDVSYRVREAAKTVWVDAPSLDSFTATSRQIGAGGSVSLSWTSTGATGVTLTGVAPPAATEVTTASPFIDVSGSGTQVTLAGGTNDSGYYDVVFPAGFTFPWFGATKTAVRMTTDGWLGFDPAYTTTHLSEQNLPAGTSYRGVQIAAFWDDLKADTGSVWWKLVTPASGPRYVVVQWKGWQFYSSTYNPSNLNFEVALFEDGNFELRYGTMTGGGTSYPQWPAGDGQTMGWQNPDCTVGRMLTANTGDPMAGGLQNRSWKFTMNLPEDSTTTVTPTESTTYKLCVTNASLYVDCEEIRVVVVKPGDLLFSEAMIAPASDDAEWFEVRNVSPDAIDLAGWTVTSGTETYAIPATPALVVPAGGFAVFARNPTASGVTANVVYGSAIGLADATDSLSLNMGATVIDGVSWSGTGWSIQPGKSIALEPSAMARAATANDAGSSWCATAVTYGGGPLTGSPGTLGAGCLTGGANQWYLLDPVSGMPFIDISRTGTSDSSYLDSTYYTPAIPLGFTMPYFGETVDTMQISKHGYVAFTTQTTYYSTNAAIPGTAAPNGFVAPFWDYVYSTTGTSAINHQLKTVNGHQVMIVQWTQVAGGSMSYGTLDFQLQLWDTGDVGLVYRNVNRTNASYDYTYGSSATLGMENLAGTIGLQIFNGSAATGAGPVYSGRSYLIRRR